MGDLRKTNKAAVIRELEKGVDPIEEVPASNATIIDGMPILRNTNVNGKTYGELATIVLRKIIASAVNSTRIDVVFDVYIDNSIKSAGRLKRASSGRLTFQQLRKDHQIKQWNHFVTDGHNKTEIISLLVQLWSENITLLTREPESFFVTSENKCYEISRNGMNIVSELESSQEEADTRMMLHAKHAKDHGYCNTIIKTPDTDVFVICLSLICQINTSIIFNTGTRDKTRMIHLNEVKENLSKRFTTDMFDIDQFSSALLGVYAYTGCDTVGAFSGKGKIKAIKLMSKNRDYVELFSSLGSSWNLTEEHISKLEEFTCHFYGHKSNGVNLLRYKKYCSTKGKCDIERLPPCKSSLYQHCLRANYQCRVWRLSLEASSLIPSAHHGWIINNDGISIKWMSCKPAPDEVIRITLITF